MSKKSKHRLTREQLEKKLVQTYPHFTLINTTLGFLFVAGLFLTVWEINIYRDTFIPVFIPLSLWLLTGLAITPFIGNFLAIYMQTPYLFFQFFYSICAFGGVVVFTFMALNYYCADKQTVTISTDVISTGHLARGRKSDCAQPYIIINYQDKEKEIMFSCNTDVSIYKKVDLTIAKGLFGFDVVLHAKLHDVEGTF